MVVDQTAVVVSGQMQTVWHQPVSWRGQRRGCRRCSGCCCPGQSSHWGSTLTPSKIPAWSGRQRKYVAKRNTWNNPLRGKRTCILYLHTEIFLTHAECDTIIHTTSLLVVQLIYNSNVTCYQIITKLTVRYISSSTFLIWNSRCFRDSQIKESPIFKPF